MSSPCRAIVLGRGADVWQEHRLARSLTSFDFLVAVNVAGRDYQGRVDHWVTLHPELFPGWIEARIGRGYAGGMSLWSAIFDGRELGKHLELPLRYVECIGGSSGMLGVQVARQMGAERVVLCGIPMTNTARFDDAKAWEEAGPYLDAWEKGRDDLKGYVRSMSGWTRDLLGAPTTEWLNGN